MTLRLALGAFLALTVAAGMLRAQPQAPAGPLAKQPAPDEVTAALDAAFNAAYNLDHDDALRHARRAIELGPDASRAHRGLASILWLRLLFNRGAVSVDHYMGSISKSQARLPKPDPAIAAEFKAVLDRALALANDRLKANSRDLQARYDLGAAYGLQASYVASVEGSVMSAFGIARRAYNAQEEVLDRDPSRVSAGVIVGTYRYIVSTLNLPTRVFAYIVGFGGGKEKGIAMLEAARRSNADVDAKTALMLIYSREGRHDEVVRLARELSSEFPRNRLFVLEEGAAAIRAGKAGDADAVLTRGIERLAGDKRPRVPGEEALWYYKRGLARLNLNRPADAAADLNHALAASPTPWVKGRIHVELGKLADLAGNRADALSKYAAAKSMCKESTDTICEKEADRLLKRPFSFSGGGRDLPIDREA